MLLCYFLRYFSKICLSDIYVYLFVAVNGSGLDDHTDRLCDSSVLTDNHSHIVGSNAKGEIDAVFALVADNNDLVGIVYDSACDVAQGFFQIYH